MPHRVQTLVMPLPTPLARFAPSRLLRRPGVERESKGFLEFTEAAIQRPRWPGKRRDVSSGWSEI